MAKKLEDPLPKPQADESEPKARREPGMNGAGARGEKRQPRSGGWLATYRGTARELRWLAFNLAVWPIGFLDEAVRTRADRIKLPAVPFLRAKSEPTKETLSVPILLVHGYFHNRSGFMVMNRALKKLGFCNVHAFNYNPVRRGIPEIAEQIGCKIDEILEKTGARKVHVIGHSLGGLVARYYVEQMGGFRKVNTLITLGTPHRGTVAAYFARSQAAKQMRPGSDLLRVMNGKRKPRSVNYISYYSDLDALVVPSKSAKLGKAPNVRNVLVHDLGHMSLLISNDLIASIASTLTAEFDVGDSLNGGEEIHELFG